MTNLPSRCGQLQVVSAYPAAFNGAMKARYLMLLWLIVASAQARLPIARVTDTSARYLLFEGETVYRGHPVPDGNIWLYDKRRDELVLLTPQAIFGEAFFAYDARFVDEGRGVVFGVNYTDDPFHLYYFEVASGQLRWLTSAGVLGLVELDTRNPRLAGSRLRYRGVRLIDAARPEAGVERVIVELELRQLAQR